MEFQVAGLAGTGAGSWCAMELPGISGGEWRRSAIPAELHPVWNVGLCAGCPFHGVAVLRHKLCLDHKCHHFERRAVEDDPLGLRVEIPDHREILHQHHGHLSRPRPMKLSPDIFRTQRTGLTIVEMLVAMTAFTFLIGAIVALQLFAVRIFQLAATKLTATADGRKTM